MGWLAKILTLLPLVPGLVAGIEKIHGSSIDGATKKQLALESLGLATQAAGSVVGIAAPGLSVEVQAATGLASEVIDSTVKAFNLAGWSHAVPMAVKAFPQPLEKAPKASQQPHNIPIL